MTMSASFVHNLSFCPFSQILSTMTMIFYFSNSTVQKGFLFLKVSSTQIPIFSLFFHYLLSVIVETPGKYLVHVPEAEVFSRSP